MTNASVKKYNKKIMKAGEHAQICTHFQTITVYIFHYVLKDICNSLEI